MAWRTVFGNLAAGDQSLSLFDQQNNDVGLLTVVPCTATGTNAIALAPNGFTATQSSYANYQLYSFIAANSSTGSVTVNVNSIGALNLYQTDGATQAGSGSIVAGAYYIISYNSALNSNAGGFQLVAPLSSASLLATAPTIQSFTSGSAQTYTTPAGVKWLRVIIVGGGGGGGGMGAGFGTGGTGGTTTFGSTTAIGGSGGVGSNSEVINAGGVGGTGGTTATGTAINRVTGSTGGPGQVGAAMQSGYGASSLFGGGAPYILIAAGIGVTTSNGVAGIANTGGGGSGAGNSTAAATGGGGGSGEFVEFLISAPSAIYTYTVGTAGTAGTGAQTGGAGAAGKIIVEEHYNY